MTVAKPATKGSPRRALFRRRRPATAEEWLARVLTKAPPWLASAIVHAVVIGIMLQVTALTRQIKDHRPYHVTVQDPADRTQLERGDDVTEMPIPVVEPIIKPASFRWDEDQTASKEALEELARDDEFRRVFALYGPYGLRSGGGRAEAVRRGGGTTGSEKAVELALEWLERHQSPDGAWRVCDHTKQCIAGAECTGLDDPLRGIDPGLTGLSALAFLGADHTDQHGRFKQTVAKAMDYLLRIQARDGCFGHRAGSYYIYNHAICTLAVCEAYGMTRNVRYKPAAEKGIAYILKVQHIDGGWGYVRQGINVYKSDVSVTGWQVMALKSAELAGIKLPAGTWKRIIEYVDGAGDEKGLAGYTQANQFVTPINPSTIAVGLLCRQFAPGEPDADKVSAIADSMVAILPSANNEGFYYYAYYGSLSLFQYGGPKWRRWNTHVRDLLVKRQKRRGCEAGSWEPGTARWGSWAGRVYTTAMAALTLEVYYRYLPIHRGYAENAPEAAALREYQKALSAYRHCIKLSGDEKTPPEKADEARRRALELLRKYRRAATSLKAANDEAGKRRQARLAATAIRLATVHLRGEEYAECIEEVKDFGSRHADYEDQETPKKLYAGAVALLAKKLGREGDRAGADALLRAAVEERYQQIIRNPEQPLAVYLQVANDFHSRRDWWRGAEMFAQLLNRFPREPLVRNNRSAIRFKLAKCLLKSGRSTDALEIFEALHREAPSAVTLDGLADCYVQTRDFEKALQMYLELRRGTQAGSPRWWQAQHNIANTLMLLGRTDECRRLIAVQKELRPKLGGPELRAKFESLLRACTKMSGERGAQSGS